MLETILEYRKGILFVRLIGELTKVTSNEYEKDVLNVIKDNGINNIVLNFKDLTKIDYKGISSIYYLYEITKKGNILLCGINGELDSKLKKNRIFNYISKIDSEMDAFKLMKVW